MTSSEYLFEDKISEIEKSFIKKGWIDIYISSSEKGKERILLYPCLLKKEYVSEFLSDRTWGIELGREGRPSIYGDGSYHSFENSKVEPFVYKKYFTFLDGNDSYVDISEEFILYFNLYEKLEDKGHRIYYFIDGDGELDEVIQVSPKSVRVKQKYLMEYISVRRLYFSIGFDMERFSETLKEEREENYVSESFNYTHIVQPYHKEEYHSWIHGKLVIPYDEKIISHYFHKSSYESFITGYEDDGNLKYESCEKNSENYLKFTFFKKEVLNKYYSNPSRYKVDEFGIRSNFFSLKIDNNISDYVPVFLTELGSLPIKEQHHWKQFNIPPKEKVSNTFYRTMIEGEWGVEPESIDFFFKEKYTSFNKDWKSKYGWNFYKPLKEKNQHYWDGLHLPTSNNIKEFCQQMLGLVLLMIDSLNEKELVKGLKPSEEIKGISKLEFFLESRNKDIPKMIHFLRQLQNLRSGLVTHRFSDNNKRTKKSLEYFNYNNDNYIEVSKDIFIKSIITISVLEKEFDLTN